jgi:hypothetical protein
MDDTGKPTAKVPAILILAGLIVVVADCFYLIGLRRTVEPFQ